MSTVSWHAALRPAATDRPLLDVIAGRWSSRAIDPARPVARETLLTLLEAARWAPSNGNAQPWRYLVFDDTVPEARERARDCLNAGNAWAKAAPALLLSLVQRNWPDSAELNRAALHDVGAASMALCLQGMQEALVVHQMAGFDLDRARREFAVPSDADPVAMIAIGYPGDVGVLDERTRRKQQRPRARRPVHETAFLGGYDGEGLRA